MSLESDLQLAVYITVMMITVLYATLIHRSPLDDQSLAMDIRDWWRSRNGGTDESE